MGLKFIVSIGIVSLFLLAVFPVYCSSESSAEGWSYDDKVLLFTTPGCDRCHALEPSIVEYCSANGLELVKYDLSHPENLVRMYSLLLSRGLPVEWTGKAPSVFTQASQAIAASTIEDLVPIWADRESIPPQKTPYWGTVAAGLADGVNPCTLNVLLILLSICLMADKRRVVPSGLMFIAGVVGTYFITGLGLGRVLEPLRRWAALMSLLYIAFGVGLICMVLRPPTRSLAKIKGVLGKQIRNLRSPGMGYLAFFASGVLSSAFEFVCTGQIYVPYVLYLSTNAPQVLISNLALYNLAFALPMVVMVSSFSFGFNATVIQRYLKTPFAEKAGLVATALLSVYFIVTGILGLWKLGNYVSLL